MIVLASGSPRRHELLTQLGLTFRVVAPDVDEAPAVGEAPGELVRRLARAKAAAVVDGDVVVAADTIVDVDGEPLGKPVDEADAERMLRRLSGRGHHVHTGIVVRAGGRELVDVVSTQVRMASMTPAVVAWYLGTGEPLGKAGAYAIQGAGGVLVESVRGSVSNVVGLPLTQLAALLSQVGAWPPAR